MPLALSIAMAVMDGTWYEKGESEEPPGGKVFGRGLSKQEQEMGLAERGGPRIEQPLRGMRRDPSLQY